MDLKDIQLLVQTLDQSNLTKLEFTSDNHVLKLEKNPAPVEDADGETVEVIKTVPLKDTRLTENSVAILKEGEVQQENTVKVIAPLIGVFYGAPSPKEAPYVTVGKQVQKGDTLFILEAMKVLNEIKAPVDGFIKAIHLADGDLAEFDQLVMEIGE